jgi:hypothetical protein
VVRGVDVDAKAFVGFLLDDSGIVIRTSSSLSLKYHKL